VRGRTVVSIGDLEQGYSIHLDESPVPYPGAFTHHRLNLSLDDVEKKLLQTHRGGVVSEDGQHRNGAVMELGRAITEALKGQPAVKDALTTLFTPAPESRPLFLRLDSHKAEAVPWETLWADSAEAFVALHAFRDSTAVPVPCWPLGRLAAPVNAPPQVVRIVQPYLKVSAVISAACVDGIAEWKALSTAVASLGSRVRLQVFVGEESLYEAIAASSPVGTTVEYVGDTIAENHLISKVLGFAPNILHFFCHGSAVDGSYLEIATRADRIKRQRKGSLILTRNDLAAFGRLHSIWLITLNCCDGAAGNHELRSIARELVDIGTPAVVAMRETIAPSAANHMTAALYSTLAAELAQYLPSDAASAQRLRALPAVTWATAVQAARLRICASLGPAANPSANAMHARDWSVPVLHASRSELHLRPMPSSVPGMSDERRIALRATIDKLESSLVDLQHQLTDFAVRFLEEEITKCEGQLYAGWDP
jgi:hypothetical protein